MNTVNISLPKSMYQDAKKVVQEKGYSSVSELVRDGLRRVIYPELTENGFTPEFEEMVLEAAKEPVDYSNVWETKEDVKKYFSNLRRGIRSYKRNK